MSGHPAQNGPGGPSAPNAMAHQQNGVASGQAQQGQNMSQANLNQIVLEYLLKKGYKKTERTLREESENVDKDGRPLQPELGPEKYKLALDTLFTFIDQNLELYKYELNKVKWPMFIYSYLELVENRYLESARELFDAFKDEFERVHADELRTLETITLPQHVLDNAISKLYKDNRYRLPLNKNVYYNLMTFLEEQENKGGPVIVQLLSTFCEVKQTDRGPVDQFSFEAIINRAHSSGFHEAEVLEEGVPGGFTGVSNQDLQNNSTPLKLGPQPMETDLAGDVRAELEEVDTKNPPRPGQPSYIELFDQKIKREESADAVPRNEIPYPPSRARDVVMEVQKIKEHRDRFKIDGRTGGVGPAVSVCMYTFHNTLESVICIEISGDNKLIAVGTEESYIRVWDLEGGGLKSALETGPEAEKGQGSRRLIGHSAPVYGLSFSPSIARAADAGRDTADTSPQFLLSCSSDSTIRLWLLNTWTCAVVFKSHIGPVWNVRWSPHGHYFASCGWDKKVHVWTQDHITPVRHMIGHDTSVCQVAWHPNGIFVFSASDEADKTVRMWALNTGKCVRIFTGHTEFPSALECAPNGKILASADGGGSIILWDIEKGTQIKRCRGHGKGGVWSLSFSVESTVLTSGGADGTVRVWDVAVPSNPDKNPEGEVIANGGQADATRINGTSAPQQTASGASGAGKRKGKDTVVTPDQLSAFPTKKTPVYKVKFTEMNLILAAGCYQG